MIGLRPRNVTVTTRATVDDGDPFGANVVTKDVIVTALVERVAPSIDTATGDALTNIKQIRCHVYAPTEAVVSIGDTLVYHKETYVVTGVDSGIQDENIIKALPIHWYFNARARTSHG